MHPANAPMENVTESTKNDTEKCISMTKQEDNLCGEFVWNIKNLSGKLNTARIGIDREIYSDPFYSHKNGYRMCLRVEFDRYYGVHIHWCLMRGPFDDDLEWPFKYDVTICIIDQQTGNVHQSKTITYIDRPNDDCWRKPANERNSEIACIITNSRYRNNQLSIKPMVSPHQNDPKPTYYNNPLYVSC